MPRESASSSLPKRQDVLALLAQRRSRCRCPGTTGGSCPRRRSRSSASGARRSGRCRWPRGRRGSCGPARGGRCGTGGRCRAPPAAASSVSAFGLDGEDLLAGELGRADVVSGQLPIERLVLTELEHRLVLEIAHRASPCGFVFEADEDSTGAKAMEYGRALSPRGRRARRRTGKAPAVRARRSSRRPARVARRRRLPGARPRPRRRGRGRKPRPVARRERGRRRRHGPRLRSRRSRHRRACRGRRWRHALGGGEAHIDAA